MKNRDKILESISPDGKWSLIVEGPSKLASSYYANLRNQWGSYTGVAFGYDAHPGQVIINWNLPDSVLGIFLSGKCYLLFRWGVRDWRNRDKSRTGEDNNFSAEEIEWFCAKQEVNSKDILEPDDLESAYLIVKRFEVLYKKFAQDPKFNLAIYALPLVGTDWRDSRVRYQGLDRDAITAWDYAEASAAQKRMAEIGEVPTNVGCFLLRSEYVTDVLGLAEAEAPGEYEPVWARLAGSHIQPPTSYRLAGYEPSWFPDGFFSALCDCMCFPRWHGTDPEGVLFRDHFRRLNSYGLFDSRNDASEFLTYYVSFDEAESGDYSVIEVWIPDRNS